jgi:hypothetical protein
MAKEVWLICNAPKKSKHCKENCFCGVPHLKEPGHDSCHLNKETCALSNSGIIRVICKPIKRKKI